MALQKNKLDPAPLPYNHPERVDYLEGRQVEVYERHTRLCALGKKGKGKGRGKTIAINYQQVFELREIQCTDDEIAAVLGMSIATVHDHKRHDPKFCDAYYQGASSGKIALRRFQLRAAAKGNIIAMIWCGKQYLGQSDKVISEVTLSTKDLLEADKEILNDYIEGSFTEAITTDKKMIT